MTALISLDILSRHQLQSTSIRAILYFFLEIRIPSWFVASFNQIYNVFGGIWQYNVKIRK